jgi:hypothetical protein
MAGLEKLLVPVLSRDIFNDRTHNAARGAMTLGLAHRKFRYYSSNVTPFGAVIAAPPPEWRELFCRDGLKYYARIGRRNIEAALRDAKKGLARVARAAPGNNSGSVLKQELMLAARMAIKSGEIMLWQKRAVQASPTAPTLARKLIREMKQLDKEFKEYWPLRNKGTTKKCSLFLQWRIRELQNEKVFYPPEKAKKARVKAYAAE